MTFQAGECVTVNTTCRAEVALALSVALGGSLLGGGALVYATWPGAPAVSAGGALIGQHPATFCSLPYTVVFL